LAAPQIGVSLRVFVWDVDETLGHLINPTLTLSDEMQDGEEGCLSFPELRYETPRAMRAVAKGFNMYGEPITVEGSGILFIDKLSTEDRKLAMKEIRESEWFNLAAEKGQAIQVKDSPHSIFGRNT
jgi:peptide deformylase